MTTATKPAPDVRSAALAVAEAPKPPSLATIVRQAIDRQTDAFRLVLPAGVDHARYSRLVLTAVKANPGLAECFQTQQGELSALLAAMQCAALGLEPNTLLHEALLKPRRNTKGGYQECTLEIEYRGYMKLGRRSGDIKDITAECVYEGDEFESGTTEEGRILVHRPCGEDDPQKITHAYCIVWFLNGGRAMSVLTRRQIEKRRASSDSWKRNAERSPWTTHFDRMARKSAIRALFANGEVPLSADTAKALEVDGRPLGVDEDGVIQATATDHDDEGETLQLGEGA